MPPNHRDNELVGSQERNCTLGAAGTKYIPVLFKDMEHAVENCWEFPKERLLNLKTIGSGKFGTVKKVLALPFDAISGQKHINVAGKMVKGLRFPMPENSCNFFQCVYFIRINRCSYTWEDKFKQGQLYWST